MAVKKNSRKRKPQPTPLQDLTSLLSRAEVIGVILVFISAITLLSLFTSSNGALTGAWLAWLELLFGIGLWGFPIFTGVLGLWMIIRAIENMPDLPWQRPAGLGLLFLSFIMSATLWDGVTSDPLGGQVGLFFTEMVSGSLGLGGAWAFATFLAISGFVLLTDRLLVELSQEGLMWLHDWRRRMEQGSHGGSIKPVLPLPSGSIPWWKRLQERFTQRPTITMPQPSTFSGSKTITNLVRPQPEPRNATPPPPQPAPTPPPRVIGVTPATSASEIVMPHIVGGMPEWRLPRIADLLSDWERHSDNDDRIRQQGRIIQETLALFGVPADFEGAYKGPSVTQYLIKPGYIERTVQGEVKRVKIKVAKIASLANDLALALEASSVRIEAPIPGTSYVGVEVPNKEGNKVGLKELMESDNFTGMNGRLRIALGEDVKGQPVVADLARMPHLLIAGATGSGKSSCINSIICCLLMTHTPESLRLLMVDPKMVELTTYNGVPHLLSPVVTEVDKAAGVLYWAVKEMERRYTLFSKAGARDLVRYNEYLAKRSEKPLPYIVVIVDEMADLMMAAPEEVEKHVCRLAQMARAVGIHLIISTQRPSVDVITGLIKANFPSRIAFAVTSQTDSRVILDVPGAERLLGRGDMLFMAPDASKLERLQGTWLSDEEINRVVRYWKGIRSLEGASSPAVDLTQEAPPVVEPLPAPARARGRVATPSPPPTAELAPPPMAGLSQAPLFEEIEVMKRVDGRDELFDEAVRLIEREGRGSVSLLQRHLRIGYVRAARLVDQLTEAGILDSEQSGASGRKFITGSAAQRPSDLSGAPATQGDDEEDDGFEDDFGDDFDQPRASTRPRIIGGDEEAAGNTPPNPRIWM